MLLEGELEFTFREQTQTVAAPNAGDIPANAPHVFENRSGRTVHMLCQCVPAGQDEFFMAVGVPVASRDAPPPEISAAAQKTKGELAKHMRGEVAEDHTIAGAECPGRPLRVKARTGGHIEPTPFVSKLI